MMRGDIVLTFNKKKFTLKWKSILTLIIVFIIVYTFGEQMVKSYQMQKEVASIQNQISQIQKKNNQLRVKAQDLDSNVYVEKIAREKLGLVRQGEKIILKAKPEN